MLHNLITDPTFDNEELFFKPHGSQVCFVSQYFRYSELGNCYRFLPYFFFKLCHSV